MRAVATPLIPPAHTTRAFAITIAAIATSLVVSACSKPVAAPEPIRAVKVIAVTESNLVAAHEFSGEVRARVEARVGFRVGGKVTKRMVEVGQRVTAGQVLATLDPQDLVLATTAAKAQVQSAQVQADLAAADYKRFKDLKDQNFISGAELDRRDAALKAAMAVLDQAKAQFAVQGNQSGYATLVSPVAGVVTAVDAEAGMVVAAGAPVVRIAQANGRDAVFAVPEDKISLIKAGQGVDLQISAAEGEKISGVVREIAAVADPATRTYAVKVSITGANPPLGATVVVRPVALSSKGQGLSAQKLPTSALRQDGGKTTVWVLDANAMTVSARGIEVVTADANEVVIAPGALKGGEQIVAAGVHVLQAGQKVTLWRSPDAVLTKNTPLVAESIGPDAAKSVASSAATAAASK